MAYNWNCIGDVRFIFVHFPGSGDQEYNVSQ